MGRARNTDTKQPRVVTSWYPGDGIPDSAAVSQKT